MKIFKSKRGITPLIATIILIVFAVGIGAVLMGWSSKSVTAEEEKVPVAPIYSIVCTKNLIKNCCPASQTESQANLAINPKNSLMDNLVGELPEYYNPPL